MTETAKRALVIVFEGIEEIEALTPVDLLRRAGIGVTIASVDENAQVTGRNQITFSADTSLSSLKKTKFDLVFLPGGPGVLNLVKNKTVGNLLKAQAESGRVLAAICAAPKVLAANGILDGKRATSHASVRSDLPIPSDLAVVTDGNIITSQGVGTAVEFALHLVEVLQDRDAAIEIAESIHYRPKIR